MGLKERFNRYVSQLETELNDTETDKLEIEEDIEEDIIEEEGDNEMEQQNNREDFMRERSTYQQTAARVAQDQVVTELPPISTSTLSADTKITGDIYTESNLIVDGQITGNIESSQDVLINGTLEGNVSGLNISINKSMTGEMVAMSDVLIGTEANVIGDITASNVKVKGVVSGNVRASGRVELTRTSSLYGDINCASIKVDEGAIISGRIEIEQSHDE